MTEAEYQRIVALEARVAELERQVNTLRRVVGTDKIVPLQAYYGHIDEGRYWWGDRPTSWCPPLAKRADQ